MWMWTRIIWGSPENADSDSVDLGWDSGLCVPKKCPGDADPVIFWSLLTEYLDSGVQFCIDLGLQSTLEQPVPSFSHIHPWDSPFHHSTRAYIFTKRKILPGCSVRKNKLICSLGDVSFVSNSSLSASVVLNVLVCKFWGGLQVIYEYMSDLPL